MADAKTWIKKLDLQPHPEGGYFKEIYHSEELIPINALPSRYNGPRSFGTSIYYLLELDQFSSFHRLKSDELWHFYDGSSVQLYLLFPDGQLNKIILGPEIEDKEFLQITIPAGCWFAAHPVDENSFSLAGCTVFPGFDFDDFELADRIKLISEFPQYEDIINKLTRSR